jgi:hypothetical protein
MNKANRTGRYQKVFETQEDGSRVEVPLAEKPVEIHQPIDPDTGRPVPIDRETISRSELQARALESIAAAKTHYLEWEGPWAVCQTCPFRHSVPLDFTKYDLVDGVPVKKPLANPE